MVVLPGLDLDMAEAEWDALFAHEPEVASPFVRHAVLAALEESGFDLAMKSFSVTSIKLPVARRGPAAGDRLKVDTEGQLEGTGGVLVPAADHTGITSRHGRCRPPTESSGR